MHLDVHCHIIYNCQDLEAAHVSIYRCMDKTAMGHLHNGILLGYKKEENFTLCVAVWMDLENIMLSEISRSEKDMYSVISLIHGM